MLGDNVINGNFYNNRRKPIITKS